MPSIIANGINGVTGQYDRPPVAAADLARALMETNGRAAAGAGTERRARAPALERALPWGVEQDDVARAGWGVVFHQDESEAVRRAIQPLVAHRAKLAATRGLSS